MKLKSLLSIPIALAPVLASAPIATADLPREDIITAVDTNDRLTSVRPDLALNELPGAEAYPEFKPEESPLAGTFSVIGTDQRNRQEDTMSFPSSAIVRITRNGDSHCTGYMVSEDTVLTAGHCLYDPASKTWFDGLLFNPGSNGLLHRPYGTSAASNKWTDVNWVKTGNPDSDWGVVKLEKPLGKNSGWFGLRSTEGNISGTKVTLRGYPGDKWLGFQMWTMDGQILESTSNRLCYTIDTAGGQSGSPIYGTNDKVAIGIHTNGVGATSSPCSTSPRNSGVRITPGLLATINNLIAEPRVSDNNSSSDVGSSL